MVTKPMPGSRRSRAIMLLEFRTHLIGHAFGAGNPCPIGYATRRSAPRKTSMTSPTLTSLNLSNRAALEAAFTRSRRP